MGLGNPLEVIMHHLLIEGMVGLSYRDRLPMVSELVYIYTLDKNNGESWLKAIKQS